mgnify:CR=1 FL=1
MTAPSFLEIAASLDLWREYADPDMAFSDDEFYSMTIDEKVEFQRDVWGDPA